MSLGWASMPVRHVRHSRPEAHREPAKKSLEDQEILGHGCGIYLWISRALRLIRGIRGTRGQLSELDPTWAVNRVTGNGTRGSTGVDHVQSEWHVTRTSVMWDFRGGGRMTCRGKSRGDGWDRYRWPHDSDLQYRGSSQRIAGSIMMVTERSAAGHSKTCSSNSKSPVFFPFYFYFFSL